MTRSKNICGVRTDLYSYRIPVGENKFIEPNRKRKRFKYRWENEETFQIFFNGKWEDAQSIDFTF
jgi:hypothetical protein